MKTPVIALALFGAIAAPAASAQGETTVRNLDFNRVVVYMKDGSKTCWDFNDVARVEHGLVGSADEALTGGVRSEPVTDKSGWSVPYGSLAMPYGPFAQMIDGKEDNGGWMGYVNDGYPDAPGLGHPFVVVDLGAKVPLTALGIQAGNPLDGGSWDVMPARVEFFVTDADDISIDMTDDERAVMNGGDTNDLSRYFPLHKRLRDEDARIAWRKIGQVWIDRPSHENIGRYFYHLNTAQLARDESFRFVKLEVTPFSDAPADRTKIFEFHVRRRVE